MYGAAGALTALAHRDRTGQGTHVDLSHLEAGAGLNVDAVLDQVVNGETPVRLGNRDRVNAPQGVYRCAGEDGWVAISVTDDTAWQALVGALGNPAWATEPSLANAEGRRAAHDAIDEQISAWCATRDHYQAMHELQAAGVAAGAVLSSAELAVDPHLAVRGFFQEVFHPSAGTHRYPGPAFLMRGVMPPRNGPAPLFGQHNDEILTELLGVPPGDLARLRAEGIIADHPAPQGD
jgi:crotonobetainyl-CoA:carnitine CoA-transferase CaiB-like acyl-CoA transferase